jgi:LacI family transcriptional regulator
MSLVSGPAASRRATARDVAVRVGCSVATVSLVVNGKSLGRVAPETERRVWDAISELDYRVNTTASALARGEQHTVAFVSPDPTNPFFSLVIDGLSDAIDDRLSLTLLVPSHGDDYDPSTVRRALDADLAGLVLASPGRTLLDGFTPTSPTILLDAAEVCEGMVSIDLDVEAAAGELAEHLVGLGHRNVAYVGVGRDKTSLHRRRDALAAELGRHDAGLPVPDVVVNRMSSSLAAQAVVEVWPHWDAAGITAVVCGDDLLAYGVMEAATRLGLEIPGRLSVVGFNDLPYSSMMRPSLTSVDLSARELGTRAAEALNRLLYAGGPVESEVLPARLVPRQSTGPARSAGRRGAAPA